MHDRPRRRESPRRYHRCLTTSHRHAAAFLPPPFSICSCSTSRHDSSGLEKEQGFARSSHFLHPLLPAIMFRARLLALSRRSASRAPSPAAPRAGFHPSQRFRSHGYAKEADNKNHRLARQYSENESVPSPSQSWTTYAIPAVILTFIGAGTYIHYNDEKRAIIQGSERSSTSGKSNCDRPVIGGPFKLVDTENNLVTEADLRGNWILMYFGYTSSPDVGPDEVQKMAKAINILETEHDVQIKPVFITIDPLRDSFAQLRAYLKEIDPRIIGLTGTVSAVRQMAQEYRVFFKKVEEGGPQDYLIETSHHMYLLDPNMEIVKCFGVEYDARQLAEGIQKEVKAVK